MCAELTPLFDETRDNAICWMLHISDIYIMLDCGWNHDPKDLSRFDPYIPNLRAVLLSQSSLSYIGGLPYIAKHPHFHGKIYATFPVQKFSQMVMYDYFQSNVSNHFSVEDINNTWEKIQPLRYSQRTHIKERGLAFAPLRAGYSMGGSIWKIVHNMQEILYAPCYNPQPMRHIPGLDFESTHKSSVFIADSLHADHYTQPFEAVSSRIIDTLNSGGSVLIPIEASGMLLETILLLDQLWEQSAEKLAGFSLVFLSSVSSSIIEFAKSFLEWMNDEILNRFEGNRDNPFNLKFCRVITTMEEMPRFPCCVLATPMGLESGFSRELFFRHISPHPNNLVLFLTTPRNLAHEVLLRPHGEYFEIDDWMLEYPDTIVASTQQEESTLSNDSDSTQEENKAMVVYGPKLFDEKDFVSFSVCEWKHFCDNYGESMEEQEMILWNAQPTEKPITELTTSAINSYVLTVAFKVQEEEKRREGAAIVHRKLKTFLNASMEHILCDFRANGISIRLALAKIKPKKLFLINYNESNLSLLGYCREQIGIKHVEVPSDLTSLIPTMTVQSIKIDEEDYNKLKFMDVDEYEIAYIRGQVDEEGNQLFFNLDTLDQPKYFGLMLGALNLGSLRNLFIENGFKAEFREGKLVVNDKVLVYQTNNEDGQNHYALEGVISKEYYEIRAIIYSQQLFI